MADKIFFKTGSASSLPTTKTAGQLLFAIDGTTGSIYLDKDSNTRIKFNADAVKLATARTINGTLFDGSGNITTDKWGAARDFTIGNSKKSVNGSAGVSWSLSEIGAVQQVSYSNSIDANSLYDTGVYNITSSALTNGPSSYAFGQIFTMAYRKPTGNTTPDHAGQIYIHGGDTANSLSNVLCFRTSNSSTWSPWQMTAHGTAGTAVGSSTVPVYMSSNGTITACGSSLGVNITGSAAKLTTARNIALAGDVTGSTSFDGSSNVSITTVVSDDSHNHSYSTINLKGNYVSNTDYATLPNGITYIEMPDTAAVTGDPTYGAMLTVKYSGNRAFQIAGNSTSKLYFRGVHSSLSSDAGTGYGAWRAVALSDGGTYTMNITGNASGTAGQLKTARNITISGTASSSVGTFDGSANTTIYMPLTIDGFNEIKTKKLTITGTEQVSHIAFSRGAWNYFTAPTSGGFAFVPNGGTTTHGAGATFVIAGTTVFPGEKDNTIDLGTSTYKWKNVYATTFTGALSGNATTATTLATTRALRISDTANNTSTASFNGSADATLYIPTTIKGFTSIESDKFVVNDKVTLQYNATNECLEFVFA